MLSTHSHHPEQQPEHSHEALLRGDACTHPYHLNHVLVNCVHPLTPQLHPPIYNPIAHLTNAMLCVNLRVCAV